MARPTKQQQLAICERRERIAHLYLTGKTQREISSTVGVVQSVVSDDLAKIRELWLKSALVDFDTRKAQEIAKLDHLERTYLEAYERSCRYKVKRKVKKEPLQELDAGDDTVTEKADPPKEVVTERTVEREELLGDPRFLDGAMRCVEQRCKLLGLYPKADDPAAVNVKVAVLVQAIEGVSDVDIIGETGQRMLPPAGGGPGAAPG